ncbi:hypothetical protein PVAP13_9NG548100 [Panicum virgatum]|uniref:Cytochrome P450 709B2 n=1 Tax=Panicum virgatum TaxID=38727 RepID=A0A8T0MZS1_PANVG|nr:hypothetical protein PVAP13_9NG548100 [Panicum virgatum]
MAAAAAGAVAALMAALLLALLWRLAWRPRAVARAFARQGVRGPPYTFLAGSLPEMKRLLIAGRVGVAPLDATCHDIMPVLLPMFHRWVAHYGKTFLFWIGPIPAFFSTDLHLVKQVLADRTGLYQKDFLIPVLNFLFGNGVVFINGDDWKRHRKVVLPAFTHDKIKSMSAVTAEVTKQMMQQWREQAHQSGGKGAAEIDMIVAFNDLTSRINGRVAFGTSHQDVEEVVAFMREMQKLATSATLDAPILWYLPTRRNWQVWRVNKQLRSKIMSIMQARLAAKGGGDCGNDLLGLLLEAWTPQRMAGAETLTTDEVGDAGEAPSADVLGQLKLLHMVLLEASRLYPPFVYIQRRAAMDAVLGGIKVPRGTVVSIPIAMLHRDKEVWGPDADEFNPMRFEHGAAKAAKDPKALLTFSMGPRVCTGQSFGIVEAQVAMAMILSKFSFSLSPKYVHKPKYLLSLTPRRGMPLIVKNLDG